MGKSVKITTDLHALIRFDPPKMGNFFMTPFQAGHYLIIWLFGIFHAEYHDILGELE